jgi:hypothetical protein
VENTELMRALLDLADRCGVEVRSAVGDGAPDSGVCRLRDRFWVVLSDRDPVALQIDVLAGALGTHAAAVLEGQYLPPAVRDRIEAAVPPGKQFS